MTKPTVLIVDDDKMTRNTLSLALEEDYSTCTANDGIEALKLLKQKAFDIVLSDLDMPGIDGLKLLEKIGQMENKVPLIVITGQGTIESAVQAMKSGAYDFVTKPVNLDRLGLLMEKALENKRLKEENLLLKKKIKESFPELKFIGRSEAIRKCEDLAMQVASTKATVLIEGESGTGKELITNIIHYNSPVAHGPFIKINCSAFSESLLESELFGHEKGAFTGAFKTKRGRFELADQGTLFLDEVGEMPLSTQVKLLRFLQERTFERVGGTKTHKVDVRLISATNRDLAKMVKEGKFREDLYYRLRVVRIVVPPLRDRKEDIDDLVHNFIKRFSGLHGKPISGISRDAMELMRSYRWPGNVRELMNCIESAVVMAKTDFIDVDDIPEYLSDNSSQAETGGSGLGLIQELERKAIIETLEKTKGDKVKASRILGIGLRTLYRKIEKWEIDT